MSLSSERSPWHLGHALRSIILLPHFLSTQLSLLLIVPVIAIIATILTKLYANIMIYAMSSILGALSVRAGDLEAEIWTGCVQERPEICAATASVHTSLPRECLFSERV